MADYLKKYLVFLPGDWPAQFFTQKIIYSKVHKDNANQPNASGPDDVPLLGPLHIALNAIENVFFMFSTFFREMYVGIFLSRKPLADMNLFTLRAHLWWMDKN